MCGMMRRSCVVGVLVLAVVGLAACGGSGSSGSVVAQVGGSAISERLLDHWVKFQSVSSYENNPQSPVPSWVLPDPPSFATCVAHLRAGQPKVGVEVLRRECRTAYQALRARVLETLIHFRWLTGEAAELGIQVSDGEVSKEFARFMTEVFHSDAALRNYLRDTGLSLAEELYRMKIDLFQTRLQNKVIATAATRQGKVEAYKAFAREFTRKWTARTSCDKTLVVEGCKQYKGPGSPA